MASAIYMNFDSDFGSKYATLANYLSKGSSGHVFGPIPWHDMQVAIKQVMFACGKVNDEFKRDLEAKREIWASLEHKNLMRIHRVDLSQLPKVMFIVMDFAAGGALHRTLTSLGSGNKLPIQVLDDWTKQIAEGMLYLHQKNIVHRDLKSSNILLMEPFDIHNTHTITTLKITDFDDVKEYDQTATMSFVGTFAYMAPEVLGTQRFSKASDVWSFGVVVWEMLSGDIPHKGLEPRTIMLKSHDGTLDGLPIGQSFPEDYKLILKRCWNPTCGERLSFDEVFCVLQRMAEGEDVTEILKFKGNMSQECSEDTPKASDEAPTANKDSIPKRPSGFNLGRSIRDRFRKDLGREKYKSELELIGQIDAKTTEQGKELINGMTVLDNELFVVRNESSSVEVYDLTKMRFIHKWNLKELFRPRDIGSCRIKKCLYFIDHQKSHGQTWEIFRIDPKGTLITKWSTGDDHGRSLHVTDESNVILTVSGKDKFNEYSPDGHLIREINLSPDAKISLPWHAIKLTNGHFVVSHGLYDEDLHRVCMVDVNGKLVKSFGGKRGSTIRQMDRPVYLSVDENGFVLVVDQENSRILLLDTDLKYIREILSKEKHKLRYPKRILLDGSRSRIIVGDNTGRLILIFDF